MDHCVGQPSRSLLPGWEISRVKTFQSIRKSKIVIPSAARNPYPHENASDQKLATNLAPNSDSDIY